MDGRVDRVEGGRDWTEGRKGHNGRKYSIESYDYALNMI